MDRDSDLYNLPRPRKVGFERLLTAVLLITEVYLLVQVVLVIILASVFVNMVLLVTTLVRPVPQFSSSGMLLEIQAVATENLGNSSTYNPTKRWLSPDPTWPIGIHNLNLSLPTPAVTATILQRSDDVFWAGDECEACEEKQPSTPEPAPTPKHTSTQYITRSQEAPEHTTYKTRTKDLVATQTGNLVTRTASADLAEATALSQEDADLSVYVSIWVGPMGACMQRFAGNLVCTSASFTPSFGPVYNQSGLDASVIALLPGTTRGTAVGLLLATMAYGVCLVLFGVAISPPLYQFTPYGKARSLDIRHQVTLAVTSVLATIALIAVVASTIVLRNDFGTAVRAIPALDGNLRAKTGGAFPQLYAVCILGGLSLLQCLTLIAEDLRFPWWYISQAQRQRNPWQVNPDALNFTQQGLVDKAKQRAEREAEAERVRMQLFGGGGHMGGQGGLGGASIAGTSVYV